MKKRLLLITSALLGLSALFYSDSLSRIVQSKSSPDYVVPDTPETKEIIRTVERAYDIEAEAAFNLDIKKFPDVFINDPRFPVSPGTLETVRELTENPSLESAGYLDYKIAYFSWRIKSTFHAEKVKDKAKQENRDLTEEEAKSLVDKYGRIAPAHAQIPARNLPLKFLSVSTSEDVATVVVDDGPWTLEIYLVQVGKKWYIAGVKGLTFHP